VKDRVIWTETLKDAKKKFEDILTVRLDQEDRHYMTFIEVQQAPRGLRKYWRTLMGARQYHKGLVEAKKRFNKLVRAAEKNGWS